jgi:hypothetical protein
MVIIIPQALASCLSLVKGANYLAGLLVEEQRTDARRAQAAIVVGEDLVHLDPE